MNTHFENGKKVLETLTMHGHLAYFVGGFVRDFLLETATEDIDITTSATPDEVLSLFESVKPTGIKYGTVTVFYGTDSFEVTTFRSDGTYKNHRHPSHVVYSKTLKDDLIRRDFTINGMAMNLNGKIIDEVGGTEDLKNKLIRAIDDPITRFQEDSLRIMRAFRFVSKTGFDIETNTANAIRNSSALLKEIANERVLQEFKKIAMNPYRKKAYHLLVILGVADTFSELREGLILLSKIDTEILPWPQFFTLCFFLNQQEIPENWRFSNLEKAKMKEVITLMSETESNDFTPLHLFHHGVKRCLEANVLNTLINEKNNQVKRIKQLDSTQVITSMTQLQISGSDISTFPNLKNQAMIGILLEDVLNKVLNKELENNFETLKEYILKTIK